MRIKSFTVHVLQALLEGALVAALIVGLIAGTALAGKPSSSGSTSGSSLVVKMVTDRNGNGGPNWNDQVTFTVSTAATDKPWVRLDCYQAGAWVSTSTAGFFEAYAWAPNFTLASGGWTSGAGDCKATLYKVTSNGRSRNITSMTFQVDA